MVQPEVLESEHGPVAGQMVRPDFPAKEVLENISSTYDFDIEFTRPSCNRSFSSTPNHQNVVRTARCFSRNFSSILF